MKRVSTIVCLASTVMRLSAGAVGKLISAGAVCALLTACEHKDLCFNHDEHAFKTEVLLDATYEKRWQYTYSGPDWEHDPEWEAKFGLKYDDLKPADPEGLRIQAYAEGGRNSSFNLPAGGGLVQLLPGEHSFLLYNNDTEYIVFDRLQHSASARATTRSRTRSTYVGNAYAGGGKEETVNPPDMLYGATVASYTAERKPEADTLPVTLRPLVHTYLVRYEFAHGWEYVALARGALAGMARSVWMHSGRTSKEEATLLYDCSLQPFGAQALVKSFGIPDFPHPQYKSRSSRRYALNLEVRLKNGKLKNFDFDVTDQVAAQPRGGVIVVRGLEISDKEGEAGGSGFDVEVNDWGNYEDIELPL